MTHKTASGHSGWTPRGRFFLARGALGTGLAGSGSGRLRGVQPAVQFRVSLDDLHVVASLREGDRFDELAGFFKMPPPAPQHDAAMPGVVGREGVLDATAAGGEQTAKVEGA